MSDPNAPKPIDALKPASPAGSTPASNPKPTVTIVPSAVGAVGSLSSGPSGSDKTIKKTDKPPASSGQNLSPSPWYRSKWAYVGLAVAIIIAGGGFGIYKLTAKHKPVAIAKTPSPSPTPSSTPGPTYSPLTGLPVASAAAASQPVVGVMIENLYPNARPQSGLGSAGIVYEALAEGGITRFLAIFQEPFPSSLGPVRSLRPYYLDWGLEHDIPVAHAGGSQPALAEVGPLHLKDINALIYDGSYFYRTSDRVAPHNLYTNAQLLAQLDSKLGFATPPDFTPQPRKADQPPAGSAAHPTITINFSTYYYGVQYKFNTAADDYLRFMGGTPHVDRLNNQQIQVKNIVVEFVPTTYGTQNDGDPETDYHIIGSGKALVFEDGGVESATWSKASDPAPTSLVDATTGKPVQFDRGNTWYEIVPTGNSVTY